MQCILVDCPTVWDFNIIDIHTCVICCKIRLNPKIGRSPRMHFIYQNLDNIYSFEFPLRKRKKRIIHQNLRRCR